MYGKGKAMKELFAIDLKDYRSDATIMRRPSVRGVIVKNNKIALVYSAREKYYKFPGGGIEDGEDMPAALAREVREEVGLLVKPESISEFGSVIRRQKSNVLENTVFEQENFYFWCDCEDGVVEQDLDDYEKRAEFTLRYVDIDEAIRVNSEYTSEDSFNVIMIQREKKVLELVKARLIKKPARS